jgi:hypothetical protein
MGECDFLTSPLTKGRRLTKRIESHSYPDKPQPRHTLTD